MYAQMQQTTNMREESLKQRTVKGMGWGFAENVLGVKRLALYRKLKGEVKFTKLEKEKIKEVLGIDIDSL